MSTHPRLEARVSALERRQINTETHIEEVTGEITANIKHLAEDMTASFRQLTDYVIETEEKAEERFNKVETRLEKIEATMATKEDIAKIENRFDKIETTMLAMETRILDAFRQLLTTINPQRPLTE